MNHNKRGFGLTEVLIGIGIAGIFGGLSVAILRNQAKERRLSEAKVGMQLLHNRAQQAVKRYIVFNMEDYINADAGRRNCFDAKGNNCSIASVAPSFPGAVAGSREAEMNLMMNGDYFYGGRPCTLAICPVTVRTQMSFSCQGMSCTQATFTTTVAGNINKAANADEKLIFAALPPLSSEAIYNKTKRIGLERSLSADCPVPTGVNLVAGIIKCETNVVPNNPNEVFDSNIGFNYLNGDLRLVAGGASTGTVTGPCPTCTQPVMTNNGLECKPSVICTNPGWVVRDCKCCRPTIPGGGDGWSSFGACSASCTPGGTKTRRCQNPREEYCDSVCSNVETQTVECNKTKACCTGAGVTAVFGKGDVPGNLDPKEVICEDDDSSPPGTMSSSGYVFSVDKDVCCSGRAEYKNGKKAGRCSGKNGGSCKFCGDNGGVEYDNWDLVCK